MEKISVEIDGVTVSTNRQNSKGFWGFMKATNENVVSIPKLLLAIAIFFGIYLTGPILVKSMRSMGAREFSINVTGWSIVFESANQKTTLVTVPANRYWVNSNAELRAGHVYDIVATGTINTGTAFGPKELSDKKLEDWTKDDFMKWLVYKTDFNIALRHPNGKLVHPEYSSINDSFDPLQKICDAMLILPKDKCLYGCLIACALTSDFGISDVKRYPWKYANNMHVIKEGIEGLRVKKGNPKGNGNIEWKTQKENDESILIIKDDSVNLFFIVNDCVIPDVLHSSSEIKSNQSCTLQVVDFLIKEKRCGEDIKTHKNFNRAAILLDSSLEVARELDTTAKMKSSNSALGARDLYFLDNRGHLTVSITEKKG